MHDLKKAFLPMAGAMVAVGVLLLKEPDFGAFVVIISVAIGILFSRRHARPPVRHPDRRAGRGLRHPDHRVALSARSYFWLYGFRGRMLTGVVISSRMP